MVQVRLSDSDKVITREELNALVDKATYYEFILVLLFLKRISDTWKEEFKEKSREAKGARYFKQYNSRAQKRVAEQGEFFEEKS